MLWFLVDRDIVNWDMLKDEDSLTLRVYLYLLATSNMYDSTLSDGRVIKKGQTVFSYRSLAKELGVKEGRVRTAVKNLVLTHKLTHQSTHQYSIATFENQGFTKSPSEKFTHDFTHKSTPSKYNKEINKSSEDFFGDGFKKHS